MFAGRSRSPSPRSGSVPAVVIRTVACPPESRPTCVPLTVRLNDAAATLSVAVTTNVTSLPRLAVLEPTGKPRIWRLTLGAWVSGTTATLKDWEIDSAVAVGDRDDDVGGADVGGRRRPREAAHGVEGHGGRAGGQRVGERVAVGVGRRGRRSGTSAQR